MSTILYGIKTCDTVRKARRWLDQHDIEYRYHDLREDGLDAGELTAWVEQLGWETLLNRRSTTWKNLPEDQRADVDRERAVALLQAHPTLLKRPLLSSGTQYLAGFDNERYAQWFKQHTL